MIITVAFDVKNYVEVMEGWPIKTGEMTFFLEREDNVLKRVCVAFSGVGIVEAPVFKPPSIEGGHARLNIGGSGYPVLARKNIMNWQTVVSGLQIVDLDYDNYELRFHAENIDEEPHIHIKTFKHNSDQALNSACDFEQIGRAFCVGPISDDRIESTSHFREGRKAFEAGRYVDAYNNMFLFLETRYCDGKTKTDQQVEMLSKEQKFCEILERNAKEFAERSEASPKNKFDLFAPHDSIREKIKSLVKKRGSLRHHSLKSPLRWDPNNQNKHEISARFLGAVVGDIVIEESLGDLYASAILTRFKEISVSTGFQTEIELATHRLENEQSLLLNMSYPTTVVSSMLCLAAVRTAIGACEKGSQLADTVRFDATNSRSDLELFYLYFDVWAYSRTRTIETEKPIGFVRCGFELFRANNIVRQEFSIPVKGNKLTISDVWRLLRLSFDHIEQRDPAIRIMSLKLFLNGSRKSIVAYRVGAQVKN